MKTFQLILFVALTFFYSNKLFSQSLTNEIIKEMKFRHVGPVGNRVTTVAGVPNDPMTYYAGAASGGVWKLQMVD